MKIIKYKELFESNSEFQKMISINNDEYDKYYNKHTRYRNSKDREGIVAWEATNSQLKNFELTRPYISDAKSILDYGCGIGDYSKFIPSDIKYFGVDINPKFINLAKESYPDKKFKLISSLSDVTGKYDVVVAIGVFTWYISKQDFIDTIAHLYKIANKRVVITCLWNNWVGSDGYDLDGRYSNLIGFWKEKYRAYSKQIIEDALPDYKIEYSFIGHDTAAIIISK